MSTWTAQKDKYIQDNQQYMSCRAMGAELGFTDLQVRNRLNYLYERAKLAEKEKEYEPLQRPPAEYSNRDYTNLIDYYANPNVKEYAK